MTTLSKAALRTAIWNTFQQHLGAFRRCEERVSTLRKRLDAADAALAGERERLEERFGVFLENTDHGATSGAIAPPPSRGSKAGHIAPSETPEGRKRSLARQVRQPNSFYARVLRAVDHLASKTRSLVLPRAIRATLRAHGEDPTARDGNKLFRALSVLVSLRYLGRRPLLGTRRSEYRLTSRGTALLRSFATKAAGKRQGEASNE